MVSHMLMCNHSRTTQVMFQENGVIDGVNMYERLAPITSWVSQADDGANQMVITASQRAVYRWTILIDESDPRCWWRSNHQRMDPKHDNANRHAYTF